MSETLGSGAAPIDEGLANAHPDWRVRIFGSREYFALWVAQVVSALGDWVGLVAITALAANISGAPEAATALVLTARVAPSLFLGPFMGVLVDRYDRKRLMRIADLARALVFVALPFVDSLWGLIFASFLLEVFTLMWSPAKESLVPGMVPRDRLTAANSLGVLAAYGTFPVAGAVTILLFWGNQQLAGVEWLEPLQFNRDFGKAPTLAFYFDALTFLVTAVIVWRFVKTSGTPTPVSKAPTEPDGPTGFRRTIGEIREGWTFIFANPVVRAVNVGLAAGLLGGAMVVPLGPTFGKLVVGDANAYALFITALGFGVAIGVAALTWLQHRLPKAQVFIAALFFAGATLIFGVSMSTFWLSALGVFGLGVGAGAVYVLGYTLLHENTADDVRGRTFTTFLTLVRVCVLGALVLGPAVSSILDPAMKRWAPETVTVQVPVEKKVAGGSESAGSPELESVDVAAVRWFGVVYKVPGVRVTLWFGGLLILLASVLAARSLRLGLRQNLRDLRGELRDSGRNDHAGGGSSDEKVRAASKLSHPSSQAFSNP